MRELLYVLTDVGVQGLAVGKDEDNVDHLLTCAGFEKAVQSVSKPADRQRLATPR